MTYQETLDYMFAQLPMYHRVGAAAYKADIQPTIDMMAALGNPERMFRSIHVAGTNGKGSVSHMLASILQEAGYKVGLYTSPHLVDFRERIRINGEMIPQSVVVDFITWIREIREDTGRYREITDNTGAFVPCLPLTPPNSSYLPSLSFFEMTVGMAFDYFAREKVDVAVVEVGMGGRLDSTNVIIPELSVITNIGLDHTQFLGDTLEKIATEKAGIIKDGVPVVIGETQPETAPVFIATATAHHVPITFADNHYVVDDISRFTNELTGEYQKKNIATVLESVEVLRKNSSFLIPPTALKDGLAKVVTNTHLQGRWQTIGTEPLTICETAHNEPGIRAMLGKLKTMNFNRLHLVYGCVNDKDYLHILQLLNSELSALHSPLTWYFSQPSVPRGLPVNQLAEAASSIGIEGNMYKDVKKAIAAARDAAAPDDLVLVTGSIFLVADALT